MITKLEYNWFFCNEGEDCYSHEVGKKDVVKIVQHTPAGPGDVWFYETVFEDGHVERIYNPNKVYYSD